MTMTQQVRALHDGASFAAELAAMHAERAEADRSPAPEVVDALRESGFARHFVPGRWSGTEGSFTAIGDAAATVAAGCLSAGWCGLIYATSARMAALLPSDGQEEIWGDDPDVLIAAGVVPAGQAVQVPGGWSLSGSWRPLSGVDYADWALVCAPTATPQQLQFFAVPKGDFVVHDTWDTVGMRGTGSNSISVDAAFVPAGRVFRQQALMLGGQDPADANCHRAPLLSVGPAMFVAPVLGAARGALANWTDTVGASSTQQGPGSAESFNQLLLADASADVDAAGLLMRRALQIADEGQFSPALAARSARDASVAARMLRNAVDRLFAGGGAAAQRSGHQLQRAWRDVHCASSHAALRPDRAALHYARAVWA